MMLSSPRKLEGISIKGVTWNMKNNRGRVHGQPLPRTQEMIKQVRAKLGSPSLKWLQSHLAEQDVAALKQERPEVTLVSRIRLY
jgi:hypothetical protein